MCGICGKINLGEKVVPKRDLKRMTNALSHRGPDEEGFYFSSDHRVGLGHRRLAIIDLATGDQPMANEDKTVWTVFNGEIYNFREVMDGLVKRGHRFRTKSDTEVIVHAYEEYGEECVEHFNGMFAFAIWDERKNQLFLARDRLGQKPLFYAQTPSGFLFASEVKALLKNPEIKKEIDLEALGIYLSIGYFLSPFSIIKDIKKLPPASTLTFREGEYEIREYWDLDPIAKETLPEEERVEKFRELFEDSVKIRLMSDVPLGAFLSGGIDSTSVVSFMRNAPSRKPKTFSIGFEEATYNELGHARRAADFLETSHQDLIVKPNIEKVLPEIIWYNDEPLFDTSAVPMFFLSQMTRNHVTVALSGDGGDEMLAGYETYIADKLFSLYRKFPLRRLAQSAVFNLLPTTFGKVSFDYRLKQFVRAGNFTLEKAHYFWRVLFDEEEKKKLLIPGVFNQIEHSDTFFYFKKYFDKCKGGEFLDRAQYVDIKTWLVDDILVKVDRASMGNSLEARAPFLDYRLVEFLFRTPANLKLKGFRTKYLLKKAMEGSIPDSVIHRSKSGFNAPIPMWLREDLKTLIVETLSEANIKRLGLFNYEFVKNLMSDYFSGKCDNSLKLWALLNFTLWYDIFIEGCRKEKDL